MLLPQKPPHRIEASISDASEITLYFRRVGAAPPAHNARARPVIYSEPESHIRPRATESSERREGKSEVQRDQRSEVIEQQIDFELRISTFRRLLSASARTLSLGGTPPCSCRHVLEFFKRLRPVVSEQSRKGAVGEEPSTGLTRGAIIGFV